MADARKGGSRCRAREITKQGESEEAPDAVSSLVCPLSGWQMPQDPYNIQIPGYLSRYPGRLRTQVPRYPCNFADYWRYNTPADAQCMLGLDPWSVKHRQVATCQRSSQEPMELPLVLSISTVCFYPGTGSGSMPGNRGGRAGRGETLRAGRRGDVGTSCICQHPQRGQVRMNNSGFGCRKQTIINMTAVISVLSHSTASSAGISSRTAGWLQ